MIIFQLIKGKISSHMSTDLFVILQNLGETNPKPTRDFYIFFIISTIIVHAIVIAIVYFVFKDFFKKKALEEEGKKHKSKKN